MEWYHSPEKTGTFLINGSGIFAGDDIDLGQIFAQNMVNEGFHVMCGYGDYKGSNALYVRFTTEPNSIFIPDKFQS